MDVRRYIRKQVSLIVGPMVGFSLAAYFAYNLVGGDRGLTAWVRLSHDLEAANERAEDVKQERLAAQHRVDMLRPQHIDPDLLDEQARAALNLLAPDEVVILNRDDHLPQDKTAGK